MISEKKGPSWKVAWHNYFQSMPYAANFRQGDGNPEDPTFSQCQTNSEDEKISL